MSASASAKDYGQALTVRIWDNTSAPHSNGIDTPEQEPEPNRLANTSDAELYIFPADTSKATGQAVVICPGGVTDGWPSTTKATRWRNGSPRTASPARC